MPSSCEHMAGPGDPLAFSPESFSTSISSVDHDCRHGSDLEFLRSEISKSFGSCEGVPGNTQCLLEKKSRHDFLQ